MTVAPRAGSANNGAVLNANEIRARLEAAVAGASVEVADTTGGGGHISVRVVSEAFEGKTPVERHRLIYAALNQDLRSGALHALQLSTYTPAEWQAAGGSR